MPVLERKVITLTNAIGRKSLEEEYERIVWRNLRAKLRVCVRRLKKIKDWKLFMVHFFFTDQLGHLHRGEVLKMLRIYAIANRIARTLKAMVPKNTLFLIDHGMKVIPRTKYGDHSDYGFYSLNIPLGLKKPRIYDFAYIIRSILNPFP